MDSIRHVLRELSPNRGHKPSSNVSSTLSHSSTPTKSSSRSRTDVEVEEIQDLQLDSDDEFSFKTTYPAATASASAGASHGVLQNKESTPKKRRLTLDASPVLKGCGGAAYSVENKENSATGVLSTSTGTASSTHSTPVRVKASSSSRSNHPGGENNCNSTSTSKSTSKSTSNTGHFTPGRSTRAEPLPFSVYEQVASASNTPVRMPPKTPQSLSRSATATASTAVTQSRTPKRRNSDMNNTENPTTPPASPAPWRSPARPPKAPGVSPMRAHSPNVGRGRDATSDSKERRAFPGAVSATGSSPAVAFLRSSGMVASLTDPEVDAQNRSLAPANSAPIATTTATTTATANATDVAAWSLDDSVDSVLSVKSLQSMLSAADEQLLHNCSVDSDSFASASASASASVLGGLQINIDDADAQCAAIAGAEPDTEEEDLQAPVDPYPPEGPEGQQSFPITSSSAPSSSCKGLEGAEISGHMGGRVARGIVKLHVAHMHSAGSATSVRSASKQAASLSRSNAGTPQSKGDGGVQGGDADDATPGSYDFTSCLDRAGVGTGADDGIAAGSSLSARLQALEDDLLGMQLDEEEGTSAAAAPVTATAAVGVAEDVISDDDFMHVAEAVVRGGDLRAQIHARRNTAPPPPQKWQGCDAFFGASL